MRIVISAAVVMLVLLPFQAVSGQQTPDSALKRCAGISLPSLRLQCYDALVSGRPAADATDELPGTKVGNWSVNEKTNPIDDSKTVSLLLQADEGRSRLGQPPVLVLRCQSRKVDVFISWGDYLGSDASVVTARLGSSPPERKSWSHSTDDRATFYPGDDLKLIESLLLVDKFVAQATPYSESPITAVFNLQGLSEAVVPLRAACGIK